MFVNQEFKITKEDIAEIVNCAHFDTVIEMLKNKGPRGEVTSLFLKNMNIIFQATKEYNKNKAAVENDVVGSFLQNAVDIRQLVESNPTLFAHEHAFKHMQKTLGKWAHVLGSYSLSTAYQNECLSCAIESGYTKALHSYYNCMSKEENTPEIADNVKLAQWVYAGLKESTKLPDALLRYTFMYKVNESLKKANKNQRIELVFNDEQNKVVTSFVELVSKPWIDCFKDYCDDTEIVSKEWVSALQIIKKSSNDVSTLIQELDKYAIDTLVNNEQHETSEAFQQQKIIALFARLLAATSMNTNDSHLFTQTEILTYYGIYHNAEKIKQLVTTEWKNKDDKEKNSLFIESLVKDLTSLLPTIQSYTKYDLLLERLYISLLHKGLNSGTKMDTLLPWIGALLEVDRKEKAEKEGIKDGLHERFRITIFNNLKDLVFKEITSKKHTLTKNKK